MKTQEDFDEWQIHKSGMCRRADCFYCEEEDDLLEQKYKKALKIGYTGWDELFYERD